MYFVQVIISCSFLFSVFSVVTYSPSWVTSQYVQAASKKVIDGDTCSCVTGNSSTPTSTFPFPNAFPSTPNLGYGMSNYQGNDGLGQQMIEVNRTSLSATAFSVLVKISGFTHLWVVQVRYIAISKAFPHHLNSFDNVPIEYNNGALINISVASMTVKTYSNTINYTLQAQSIGSSYTTFSTPLTNNKILLFMTSMYISGVNDLAGPPFYPLDLRVSATPVSTSSYLLSATYSINSAMTKLHFSMIVFDQADVQSLGQYMLIYDKICYTSAGGVYPFQSQFLTNFIVGFVQFSCSQTLSLPHFITNYGTFSGSYGAQMTTAAPRITIIPVLTRYCFAYFYMKTWTCPNATFFDPAQDLCTTCPIPNCVECFSLTACSVCNASDGYFLNSTSKLCVSCGVPGCISCDQPLQCQTCNSALNYVLLSNKTCQLCNSANNYFPNSASHSCQLCTLQNCINCSSLAQCHTCDLNHSYYLTTNHTCAYCDQHQNKFINSATSNCDTCSLTHCLNCSSLLICRQCDQASNYYLNTTDSICYLCNLANCITCANLTACQICDTQHGFTLNSVSGLCEVCTLIGCKNCSSPTTCVQCDEVANYIRLVNNTCQACPSNLFVNVSSQACQICVVSNCLICSNLTSCSSCDLNNSYYSTPSLTCNYCNNTNNYFINLTNLQCQLCTVSNCLVCLNLITCIQCNEASDYFVNSSNGECNRCIITGCIDCFNLTSCNSCDSNDGYVHNSSTGLCDLCLVGLFPNTTSNVCQPCAVNFCLLCSSLSICSICDTNNSYYLTNYTCNYCNNSLNNFINLTTLGCQTCSLYQCINCSSLTICSICDITSNYLLNNTDNLCYPCLLSQCIECLTFSTCSVCNNSNGYFLNTTSGLCQFCNLTGCLECSTLTTCHICDNFTGYGFDFTSPNMSLCGLCNVSCICDGYGLPWSTILQTCTPICGDGLIRQNQQCDDNNSISHDGCSSICLQQRYFICFGQPSICNQTLFIEAQFISIRKSGCNEFQITTKIPNFDLSQIYTNIFIQNSQVNIVKTVQNGSFIQIYAEYKRDITNETILLNFSPGTLLNITYSPIIPSLHYNSQQCNTQNKITFFLTAAQYISYGILFASLLSCKIVGLELFGVLQLSYFTLSEHNFMNMYLSPFTKMKSFNGLNLGITNQQTNLPINYSKLGVASSFINNCNIMLLLLFGQFIVSLIFYVIAKVIVNYKMEKLALIFLKQGFITLAMFNIFNISFSAGVHWKYANPADDSYVWSSILLYGTVVVMIISVVAMQVTTKQGYGQFKTKFKNTWTCQIYIPLMLIYRMALGFYTAVKSEQQESTLIIIAFSIVFIMYIIINLPFSDTIQNYRCCLINATMLFILLTTNYYRTMKSTTPMQIKGRIYTPAIVQIILITTCIVFSFVILIYEIYQLIKGCRNKKVIVNKAVNSRYITQQSLQNI